MPGMSPNVCCCLPLCPALTAVGCAIDGSLSHNLAAAELCSEAGDQVLPACRRRPAHNHHKHLSTLFNQLQPLSHTCRQHCQVC
jgi:hypothetical protein